MGIEFAWIIMADVRLEPATLTRANYAQEIGEKHGPDVSIVDHCRSRAGLCGSEQAMKDFATRSF